MVPSAAGLRDFALAIAPASITPRGMPQLIRAQTREECVGEAAFSGDKSPGAGALLLGTDLQGDAAICPNSLPI